MHISLSIHIYIYREREKYSYRYAYMKTNILFRKPPLLGPPLSCAKYGGGSAELYFRARAEVTLVFVPEGA